MLSSIHDTKPSPNTLQQLDSIIHRKSTTHKKSSSTHNSRKNSSTRSPTENQLPSKEPNSNPAPPGGHPTFKRFNQKNMDELVSLIGCTLSSCDKATRHANNNLDTEFLTKIYTQDKAVLFDFINRLTMEDLSTTQSLHFEMRNDISTAKTQLTAVQLQNSKLKSQRDLLLSELKSLKCLIAHKSKDKNSSVTAKVINLLHLVAPESIQQYLGNLEQQNLYQSPNDQRILSHLQSTCLTLEKEIVSKMFASRELDSYIQEYVVPLVRDGVFESNRSFPSLHALDLILASYNTLKTEGDGFRVLEQKKRKEEETLESLRSILLKTQQENQQHIQRQKELESWTLTTQISTANSNLEIQSLVERATQLQMQLANSEKTNYYMREEIKTMGEDTEAYQKESEKLTAAIESQKTQNLFLLTKITSLERDISSLTALLLKEESLFHQSLLMRGIISEAQKQKQLLEMKLTNYMTLMKRLLNRIIDITDLEEQSFDVMVERVAERITKWKKTHASTTSNSKDENGGSQNEEFLEVSPFERGQKEWGEGGERDELVVGKEYTGDVTSMWNGTQSQNKSFSHNFEGETGLCHFAGLPTEDKRLGLESGSSQLPSSTPIALLQRGDASASCTSSWSLLSGAQLQ